LFRRSGRHVHGAFWAYDGSRQVPRGQTKLSRGNTFVVAAVVVDLPFLNRSAVAGCSAHGDAGGQAAGRNRSRA
jgi:hypothetical protein